MSQNPPVEDASDSRDGTLTETAVFDVLSNKRRRECIALLIQRSDEGTVSAWSISHAVAAALSEEESPSRKFQHSVYVSLIQTHLPKLADHDVIEYAEADKSFSPGDNLSLLEPFLDIPPSDTDAADPPDAAAASDGSVSAADAAADGSPANSDRRSSDAASSELRVVPGFDGDGVRGSYLLASLAIAVVLLLVAIREPTTVPDEVRVAVVFLLLVAIGFVVSPGSLPGTSSFFE